jgi:beta-lactamase superfamily II metal-dependent hydrolase
MSRFVRPLLALLGALLVACEQTPPAPPPGPQTPPALARRYFGKKPDGKLHVYFFDVGQGDSALIISPGGRTVLIDAGPAAAGTHLANRLPELLTDKLDLVVVTHPRAEHYSGLAAAVGAVGARKLLEPQLPNTPSDYDALLASLAGQGVEIISPAPGAPEEPLRLPLGDDTELSVLWPRAPNEPLLPGESELNSMVLRLTYKQTAVLLAGDTRAKTESRLLELQAPVRATLLKVGAHGADSTSSAPFLAAVQPRAVILSTGADNAQGTPTKAVLDRLEATKARVFRTDRDGEVHAVSDGQRFTLITQRLPEGTPQDTNNVFVGLDAPPSATAAAMQSASGRGVTKAGEAGKAPVQAGKTPSGQGPDISLEGASTAKTTSTSKPTTVTKTPEGEAPAPTMGGRMIYVASSQSLRKVFHKPDCRNAKKISPKNLVTFTSRSEAARHYEPARDCNP